MLVESDGSSKYPLDLDTGTMVTDSLEATPTSWWERPIGPMCCQQCPKRYVLSIMTCCGLMISFAIRCNLGVAIGPMTQNETLHTGGHEHEIVSKTGSLPSDKIKMLNFVAFFLN